MDKVDCIVIGAGVVGLAVARALALNGREVMVLEAANGIGTGISSRNSEVIHAGIYYPQGSLKAQLCVQGKQMLYDYCTQRGIGHSRCGKLIVATSADQVAHYLRAGALGGAGHPAIKGTLTQCDPFGIPSTSSWKDAAIIVQ